jgi:hypothetical protein
MKTASRLAPLPLPQIILLVACGTEPAQRALAPNAELAVKSQHDDHDSDSDVRRLRFSGWSAPVNLGPVVNSPSEEFTPAISRDGLSLYFGFPRPDVGMAGTDLWVSHRAKRRAAAGKTWVDVGFIGGVVPGNARGPRIRSCNTGWTSQTIAHSPACETRVTRW